MLVRSPNDIMAGSHDGLVQVGGRVVRSGETLRLTDAFASLELPYGTTLPDGALAIVETMVQGGRISTCRVIWQAPGRPADDVARIRDAGVGVALVARARAAAFVRRYFAAEGFLELETPSLVPCPGLDLHLDAFEVLDATHPTPRALGVGPRYLATSPEYQMKRALIGGLPRTYQLARAFRAGEIGDRHNPEFTMLEWYRAFAGKDEILSDTEAIVVGVFSELAPKTTTLDFTRPFRRFTVAEAFEQLAKTNESEMLRLAHEDEERFFRLLVDEIEPRFEELHAPVVLERYPAKMASLARRCPDDPRYADRFEVYAAGLELSNGFDELTCPVEQRERFDRDRSERAAAEKQTHVVDERFIASLVEGMPPSSGNALGFDRLVMLALGKPSIRDVIAWPEGYL